MKPYPQKPFTDWKQQGQGQYNRPFPLLFDDTLTQLGKMNLLMKLFELLQDNFISMQEYMDAVTQFIESEYDKNEAIFQDLKATVESFNKRLESTEIISDEALDIANTLQNKINATAQQLDDILREPGMSDAEVVAMRTDRETGKTYETAGKRLDTTMTYLSELAVNVKHFGAIGDGATDDTKAFLDAIAFLKSRGNGTLYLPAGTYLIDFTLKIDFNIVVRGAGRALTKIKVKDNSKLFHNPTRENVDKNNTNLDNLYRDYHAVFFVVNADFTLFDIELDGNPDGNYEFINGTKYNYMAESIHSGVIGYKYYHGVQMLFTDGQKRNVEIANCYIHRFNFNGIVINNDGTNVNADILIHDNVLESAGQDILSLHRVSGAKVYNNTFKNPNTHALHLYYNVSNTDVYDNKFVFTQTDYYNFTPNVITDVRKNAIQLGHGVYEDNVCENIVIDDNEIIIGNDVTYQVCGILSAKTIKNLKVRRNKMRGVYHGMRFVPFVDDEWLLEDNDIEFDLLGVSLDLATLANDRNLLNETVAIPYSTTLNMSKNRVVSATNPRNALRISNAENLTSDLVNKITVLLDKNELSGVTNTNATLITVVDNDTCNDNLLPNEFTVIDGVPNGWFGRYNRNTHTIYSRGTNLFTDVNGERVPLEYLTINSSGDPAGTFDNVTYKHKRVLTRGKYALSLFIASGVPFTLRMETRDSSENNLKTHIVEQSVSTTTAYALKTFYFDVESDMSTLDQFVYITFSANVSAAQNKFVNLGIAGLKLEKVNPIFPYVTKRQISELPDEANNITKTPYKRGLITFTRGVAYISVGTTSVEDWRPINNLSGTTAQRPTNAPVGLFYYDTTLSKPIWWTGTNWVDATGAAV